MNFLLLNSLLIQIDRLIEKSKSSITLKSFFARENCDSGGNGNGNGKGKRKGKEEGGEGGEKEGKFLNTNDSDDVIDSDYIDKKQNNLRNQKEEELEFKDDDNLLLYKMQFCILRVLKSNFLRIKEQQRSGDLVGLIYFPLSFSSFFPSSMSTESNINNDSNNDNNKNNDNNNNGNINNNNDIDNNNNNNNNGNNNVDEKNNNYNVGVENETRNEGRKASENCPYSHLTVFQLLNSLLKCIAG